MHRIADARAASQTSVRTPALREARGHEESSWATAHDEDIRRPIHEASIISGLSRDAAVAPLHVPVPVIQKERRINFTSSQKLARLR